jgi:hypothetical protein
MLLFAKSYIIQDSQLSCLTCPVPYAKIHMQIRVIKVISLLEMCEPKKIPEQAQL